MPKKVFIHHDEAGNTKVTVVNNVPLEGLKDVLVRGLNSRHGPSTNLPESSGSEPTDKPVADSHGRNSYGG